MDERTRQKQERWADLFALSAENKFSREEQTEMDQLENDPRMIAEFERIDRETQLDPSQKPELPESTKKLWASIHAQTVEKRRASKK